MILVIFGGRPQLVSKFENKCAAIIQAWFPGEEGGNALADIILGNVNPSARLCVSYPKSENKKEVNYKNGYLQDDMPQYPFGYGLSYTIFKYSDFQMQQNVNVTDDRFAISCKIKNTGKMDGAEVVQLYVSPLDEPTTMKPIQLKGFKRVELMAGEEKQITFMVSPQQLVQYLNDKWIVETGKYKFKIGTSCTDIRLSGEIDLTGKNLVLEERNIFFSLVK